MGILVVAEHDGAELSAATLSTIAAAQAVGGDIDVLVAGSGCASVGDAAAKVPGVSKVRVADAEQYANPLAESMANLVVALAGDYSHVMTNHTTVGKNFLPRAAALLDHPQPPPRRRRDRRGLRMIPAPSIAVAHGEPCGADPVLQRLSRALGLVSLSETSVCHGDGDGRLDEPYRRTWPIIRPPTMTPTVPKPESLMHPAKRSLSPQGT